MTREQLKNGWLNLPFWQRALIECSVMALIYLVVDVMFDGRTVNVVWSVLKGSFVGLACAVVDHAVIAPNGKRTNR